MRARRGARNPERVGPIRRQSRLRRCDGGRHVRGLPISHPLRAARAHVLLLVRRRVRAPHRQLRQVMHAVISAPDDGRLIPAREKLWPFSGAATAARGVQRGKAAAAAEAG